MRTAETFADEFDNGNYDNIIELIRAIQQDAQQSSTVPCTLAADTSERFQGKDSTVLVTQEATPRVDGLSLNERAEFLHSELCRSARWQLEGNGDTLISLTSAMGVYIIETAFKELLTAAVPDGNKRIAEAIHYPEHWDTMAYPTLDDAIWEIVSNSGCSECNPYAVPDGMVLVPRECTDKIMITGGDPVVSELEYDLTHIRQCLSGCDPEVINALLRTRNKIAAQAEVIAKLTKTIQDAIRGNYSRTPKNSKCKHEVFGFEICEQCIDEHLEAGLAAAGGK